MAARKHNVTIEEKINTKVSVDAKVKRGPESWAFIYITLGFALTIESTVIPMLLNFPWNIIVFIILGAFTFWLFIANGSFQNWLIGQKNNYENKLR